MNFNYRSIWDYKIQTNKSRIKKLSDHSYQGQGVTHSPIPPKCGQSKLQWWWHPPIYIWPPNMCVWGELTKTELSCYMVPCCWEGLFNFQMPFLLVTYLDMKFIHFIILVWTHSLLLISTVVFISAAVQTQQFHSQPVTHSGLTNSSILGSWIIMIRIMELWLLSSRRVRMSEIQYH